MHRFGGRLTDDGSWKRREGSVILITSFGGGGGIPSHSLPSLCHPWKQWKRLGGGASGLTGGCRGSHHSPPPDSAGEAFYFGVLRLSIGAAGLHSALGIHSERSIHCFCWGAPGAQNSSAPCLRPTTCSLCPGDTLRYQNLYVCVCGATEMNIRCRFCHI